GLLSALAATVLLRRRTPGEHGFLLALFLLETAVCAGLSAQILAGAAALASAVLAQRAVLSWHRLRGAVRAARTGGPVVLPAHPLTVRRATDGAALATVLLAVPLFL